MIEKKIFVVIFHMLGESNEKIHNQNNHGMFQSLVQREFSSLYSRFIVNPGVGIFFIFSL